MIEQSENAKAKSRTFKLIKEAKELLTRINKVNPHFIKFFKGIIKKNEDAPYSYYGKVILLK